MADDRSLPEELVRHLAELSRRLGPLAEPVQAWLAGGFAVYYYTRHGTSLDVDIKWSHRIAIPPDMRIFEISESGSETGTHAVVMDGNFGDVLGSFPPDWEKRARELHRFDNIVLSVIDAVDLAVSKVARFSDRDREDIRALAQLGLVDPEVFARRAEEALSCYVGDVTFVRCNLADAREIIESVKPEGAALEPGAADPDDVIPLPDSFKPPRSP